MQVNIDRKDGTISASLNNIPLDFEEAIGRIGAQTAKQVIIQKIQEAERDALFDEYMEQQGQMLSGVVQKYEGGAAPISLGNLEAVLPKSEQILARRIIQTNGYVPQYLRFKKQELACKGDSEPHSPAIGAAFCSSRKFRKLPMV